MIIVDVELKWWHVVSYIEELCHVGDLKQDRQKA